MRVAEGHGRDSTCTCVGMKSQHTGEVEDLGNIADVLTTRTDAQSVEDNSKMTKNTSKIIGMCQARPRMQYSPLMHEIEMPSIPDNGATSATKGIAHTHQKTG